MSSNYNWNDDCTNTSSCGCCCCCCRSNKDTLVLRNNTNTIRRRRFSLLYLQCYCLVLIIVIFSNNCLLVSGVDTDTDNTTTITSTTTTVTITNNCTFCSTGTAVGSIINPSLSNNNNNNANVNDGGGTSIASLCNIIQSNIESTGSTSTDCYESQLLTHQYCGCYTYPRTIYCNLCSEQFASPINTIMNPLYYLNRIIPTGFDNVVITGLVPTNPVVQDNSTTSTKSAVSASSSSSTAEEVTTMFRTTVTTSYKTCADILFTPISTMYMITTSVVSTHPDDGGIVIPDSVKTQQRSSSNSTAIAVPIVEEVSTRISIGQDISACDYNTRAAWYCGCPKAIDTRQQQQTTTTTTSTTTSCYLCSASTATNRIKYSNPTYKLPPSYQLTCQDLDDSGSMFTNSTCPLLVQDIPINVRAYCGCANSINTTTTTTTTTTSCNLCPQSSSNSSTSNTSSLQDGASSILLRDINMTCTELYTVSKYVTNNDNYCNAIQVQYAYQCCTGVSAQPSTVPTLSPIRPSRPPLVPPSMINQQQQQDDNNNETNTANTTVPTSITSSDSTITGTTTTSDSLTILLLSSWKYPLLNTALVTTITTFVLFFPSTTTTI